VLSRIQNNALKLDQDAKVKPLRLAEVFRSLTDGVWKNPVQEVNGRGKVVDLSIIRRNLQREYVKSLTKLVIGSPAVPADARSLARMHLKDIVKRIDQMTGDGKVSVEDTTRAHLDETRERIAKALNASVQVSEP
jgi:hypothetical protein